MLTFFCFLGVIFYPPPPRWLLYYVRWHETRPSIARTLWVTVANQGGVVVVVALGFVFAVPAVRFFRCAVHDENWKQWFVYPGKPHWALSDVRGIFRVVPRSVRRVVLSFLARAGTCSGTKRGSWRLVNVLSGTSDIVRQNGAKRHNPETHRRDAQQHNGEYLCSSKSHLAPNFLMQGNVWPLPF